MTTNPAARRFSLYAWGVVAWNLFVIVWGAAVRATGSGAGCGSHWPLCNGAVVPRAPEIATIIEFTHRITSGFALIAVAVLVYLAWKWLPKGHLARRASLISLILIVIEALLGAGLVLLEYVEQNKSLGRAAYLSAHLANTLLLVGALVSTAWFARYAAPRLKPIAARWKWALAAVIAAGVTGAVAALGDTVFPATSMADGIKAEFAADAHALLRLRLFHPVAAVLAGGFLLFTGLQVFRAGGSARAKAGGRAIVWLVVIQTAAGVVNVLLLAPVWLQLLHLFLANALWMILVITILEEHLTDK
ncbi:MAG: cytochrome oxidase assembly protein [Candidatus Solibacter sp.]|nr:cytochrome oxidase assembly protein [Candidatus Solibacter sp.]